jgi:XTP/dITP diphosphohydrolase
MARGLTGGRLVIASHNPGKVAEIAALLAPYRIAALGAAGLGLPEPEETGRSFRENAELKARAAAQAAGLPALADDSGLTVAALGGAPGIMSARWAGPNRDFTAAMARLERELAGKSDRGAAFVCALALAWPDGHCETVEGRVEGRLVWPPRGNRGFGYDPVFIPEGAAITFGEMDPQEKHRISHRADAFRRLAALCFGP